ncbi:hypothetical protein SEA_CROSBY_37 [Streptomyces phage Crosby]|nr:hypothetical protein SEA_CROSBY_37 [Streptomyces phage Crosby]
MEMIFGREPAVILAFFAALLKLLAAFGVDVTADQQAVINAVLSALVALALAVMLRTGALYAAILNLAQAGMALFVGFGLDWSADKQALVMASLAALLAVFGVRPQVEAPVSAVPLEQKSPVDKRV